MKRGKGLHIIVSIIQHCRDTGCQVTQGTKFFMVAPNVCGSLIQNSLHLTIIAHGFFRRCKAFAKLVHLLCDDSPDRGLDEPESNSGQLYEWFSYTKCPDWLRDLVSFVYVFGGEVLCPPAPNTSMKKLVNGCASNSHMLLSTKDSNENSFYSVFCLCIRQTWMAFVYLILSIFFAVFLQ
jgi:hypothetical protein